MTLLCLALGIWLLLAAPTLAQQGAAATSAPPSAEPAENAGTDLAKQLSNPVASLISVPIQNNFDWGWGLDGEGFRYTATSSRSSRCRSIPTGI